MMRRKLELWLALALMILQVTSSGWCKWKCCTGKKESIELNHQYINDPQKVKRNFCFNKISGSIRISKLQMFFF